MITTPFSFMKSPVQTGGFPTDGLIGWWDADDYTSGNTWTDRSGTGLNLTLTGTATKTNDLPHPSGGAPGVLFDVNSYGKTPTTPLIAGSTGTEWTHVEIIFHWDEASFGTAKSTYCFGDSTTVVNNISGYRTQAENFSYIKTSAGGYGMKNDTRVYEGYTWFLVRRFGYGELGGTTGGMVWALAFSNPSAPLNFFTLPTSYNYTSGGGAGADWDLGTNGVYLMNAGITSGAYAAPMYYGMQAIYDRKITDQEVQDIYDYYKVKYYLGGSV
jgi:hypothetical protein